MAEPKSSGIIGGWLGPGARLLQRHELFVAASPDRAYDALLDARLGDMPIVRLLFVLRRIPHTKEMTLRRFTSTRPFMVLEEDAPREIVFGVAGGFLGSGAPRNEMLWTPEELRVFAQDGGMRAIANFRVDAAQGGARLSTETWVETFGTGARRLFALYWLLIGPFSALIRREFLRAARRAAET
ncbi:MAG: hypothetical protein ACREJ4_08805 [Candidatus Methylomirabilaceae bacterium]